jgi:hypothetical protein
MATSSTYFLNAPSLASSTSVFTDDELSILAADGFYSDGVISREQVDGVLLPQQTCPSCATPCGTTINASGTQGIYLLDLDTGSTSGDVGAVIVRFNPYGVPDGIRGILGSETYNKLVSSVDGLHQSTNAGSLTFIGGVTADCGISGTTYPALLEYSYNGTSFVATGGTQSVTVDAGDVSLGLSAPGNTLMVIPKVTPTPSIINFEIVGPCSGTAWEMSVACPVLLTGFSSSVSALTSEAVCELTETTTYYNASLANTPGTVSLYDLVFADAYGLTQLPIGFYLASGSITGGNDWFQVDSNGVVVAIGMCVEPPVESYNCVDGTCTDPGDGTGEYATLEECETACSEPPADTEIYFNTLVEDIVTMGVNNYAGQTFDIGIVYEMFAVCDNEGTSGSSPNSATTTLYVSKDGGSTYTLAASITASVPGGATTPQFDSVSESDSYTVTGVTDVSQVKIYGTVDCDTGGAGKDGSVQVTLALSIPTANIICNNFYTYNCLGTTLTCTL